MTHTTPLHTHTYHITPTYTRFQHMTKLKTKLKISHPLLLAQLYTFLTFQTSNLNLNLVSASTSFCPCDLHNCRKSNSLVSPVISSEYVQVLCAEMPSVVNLFISHFLICQEESKTQNLNIDIRKFLPTSFPCLVP